MDPLSATQFELVQLHETTQNCLKTISVICCALKQFVLNSTHPSKPKKYNTAAPFTTVIIVAPPVSLEKIMPKEKTFIFINRIQIYKNSTKYWKTFLNRPSVSHAIKKLVGATQWHVCHMLPATALDNSTQDSNSALEM